MDGKESSVCSAQPPKSARRRQGLAQVVARTRKSVFENVVMQAMKTFDIRKPGADDGRPSMLQRLRAKQLEIEAKFREESDAEPKKQLFRGGNCYGESGILFQPSATSHVPTIRESDMMRELRDRKLTKKQRQAHFGTATDFFLTQQSGNPTVSKSDSTPIGEIDANKATNRTKWVSKLSTDEAIVTRIMMKLDSDKLMKMKQDFIENGNELTLNQFAALMMKYLDIEGNQELSENDKLLQLSRIIELFKQIDINGDRTMEWQEFTSYIINASQVMESVSDVDHIKKYSWLPNLVCNYQQSRHHEFSCMLFIDRLDHLIATETNSGALLVFHSQSGKLLFHNKGYNDASIISLEYLNNGKHSYLVTSACDGVLSFWDTITYTVRQRLPAQSAQYHVKWSNTTKKLFSTSCDTGRISCWDVATMKLVKELECHTDTVTSILVLPEFQTIVSASLDSTIVLWDSLTLRKRRIMTGHTKGVLSLTYGSKSRSLISTGFEREIYVWNAYVGNLICTLKGHVSPLVESIAVPGTAQLITADTSGVIKVWDVQRLYCVQTTRSAHDDDKSMTINKPARVHQQSKPASHQQYQNNNTNKKLKSTEIIEIDRIRKLRQSFNTRLVVSEPASSTLPSSFHCMAYSIKHKRVAVAMGKTVRFLDYAKPRNPFVSDSLVSLDCIYNEASLTFLTISGCHVKVWDAESGSLLRIFRNIETCDITAICLDGGSRRALIGNHEGKLKLLNATTGVILHSIRYWHHEEVKCIKFCDATKMFLVGYEDGIVTLVDVDSPSGAVPVKKVSFNMNVEWFRNNTPLGILHVPTDFHSPPVAVVQSQSCKLNWAASQPELKGTTNETSTCDAALVNEDCTPEETPITSGLETNSLTALACDLTFDLVVAGGSGGSIAAWKAATGKVVMSGQHPTDSVVTSLCFLTPYPLMVSTDSQGRVVIWTTSPLASRWQCVGVARISGNLGTFTTTGTTTVCSKCSRAKVDQVSPSQQQQTCKCETTTNPCQNEECEATNQSKEPNNPSYVTSSCWDSIHHVLYTADDSGYVQRWRLSKFLSNLGLLQREVDWWQWGNRNPKSNALREHVNELVKKQKAKSEKSNRLMNALSAFGGGANAKKNHNIVSGTTSIMNDTERRRRSSYWRDVSASFILPNDVNFSPDSLECSWQVHDRNVTAINWIANLNAIVTTSEDLLVRLWSVECGTNIGTLLQGYRAQHVNETKRPGWEVQVGRDHQQQVQLSEAKKVLESVNVWRQKCEKWKQKFAIHESKHNKQNSGSQFEVMSQTTTLSKIEPVLGQLEQSTIEFVNKYEQIAYTGQLTDGSSTLLNLRNLSHPFNKSMHSSYISNLVTSSASTVSGIIEPSVSELQSSRCFNTESGTSQPIPVKPSGNPTRSSSSVRKRQCIRLQEHSTCSATSNTSQAPPQVCMLSPRQMQSTNELPSSLVDAATRLAHALS